MPLAVGGTDHLGIGNAQETMTGRVSGWFETDYMDKLRETWRLAGMRRIPGR
jgi:hypothetical protein